MNSSITQGGKPREFENDYNYLLLDFAVERCIDIVIDEICDSFTKSFVNIGILNSAAFIQFKRNLNILCQLVIYFEIEIVNISAPFAGAGIYMEGSSSAYIGYAEKINNKIQQSLNFEDDLQERGLVEYSECRT